MSDTPRTDALILKPVPVHLEWTDLCRALERESASYQRCFDAAFKALETLDSVRFMWNGPIHKAVALLRAATGPNPSPVSISGVPIEVRVALLILLNHVEPGWENCNAVVKRWLMDPA